MPENAKIDMPASIEAKIEAAKGITPGDDLANPLEEALLRDILEKHGKELADTQGATSIKLAKLVDDIADLSEGNQPLLQKVAKMLDVELTQKDEASQMSYELFQKILKFQKEHEMKLTGVVDDTLYQALKKHTEEEKKADTSATPAEAEKKTETPNATPAEKHQPEAPTGNKPVQSETDGIPAPPIPEIPQAIPMEPEVSSNLSNATQQYPSQDKRISMPTPPNSPVPLAPDTTAPIGPVQTTSTPSGTAETKPEVRALPVDVAAQKTAEVVTILTDEAQKLGIKLDDITMIQSDFGQSIVDMILYYEGGGGSRQDDVGGYDLGGGIQTGSSEAEKKYALGINYEEWNKNFIPKGNVRECVQRLLHARVALTRTSCGNEGVDFDTLPAGVKGVLVDLHYNMPNNIHKFRKFWKALQDKNWAEAGKQLIDSGRGSPSSYLTQVKGRAYANAMILADGEDGNINLHRQYKEEGGSNSSNLYQTYNDTMVTRKEVKKMLEEIKTVDELIQITTSAKLLTSQRKFGDKGSTRAVIEMIKGFKKKYPGDEEKITERMKEILQEKIGNFTGPLDGIEKVGAFQQLVYLTDPEGFKQLEYIDGENGPRTQQAFDTLSKGLNLKK